MLYNPNPPAVNLTLSIRGRALAHGKRSARQRAGLAAQLVAGNISLARPTMSQAATLAGADVIYVRRAFKLDLNGHAALAAGRPVLLPVAPKRSAISEAKLNQICREVGIERLWAVLEKLPDER